MFQDTRFHQHYIRFDPGQVMVIYTDGITEASNEQGEEFGYDRFAASVLESIEMPAKKMVDHIRKKVADFSEKKFLDDDGTLFIVKARENEKDA
jgi:phosphoserine phosphatase RsbU/P